MITRYMARDGIVLAAAVTIETGSPDSFLALRNGLTCRQRTKIREWRCELPAPDWTGWELTVCERTVVLRPVDEQGQEMVKTLCGIEPEFPRRGG